jgi:hypothetical protein
MTDHYLKRRLLVYRVHLIALVLYFLIQLTAWLALVFGAEIGNTDQWLLGILIIHVPTIIYNIILEAKIQRDPELRQALEDELSLYHRLLAWRNAFFGTILFLLLLHFVSGFTTPPSQVQMVSTTTLFGAITFLASSLWLGREGE